MTVRALNHLCVSALLTGALAISSPSHAQPTSDMFSSSGEYDRFAVGGAHRWFDNHTADFRQKGNHCLTILDQAKIDQDEALVLYEQARQPGIGNATELVRQANQKIQMRGDKLRAFTDCVNQANRRPMLQGRIEQHEPAPDQQPDSDKKPPPKQRKSTTPPPRKVPPPRDPGPDEPISLPVPLPPEPPNQKPPGGTSDRGPGRYKFGAPDPPFMFADGVSKGISDCFAENLPSDLATAPLAVIKRLERIKKAVEIIGKAGSIYAIYEDLRSYDPTADPYETGKWLGKLICDGKDLREAVKQRKKPTTENKPSEPEPKQSPPEDSSPKQPSKAKPSPDDGGPFTPKTHFPPAPDPLKRGMPLEDHKQLVKLAVDEHNIIVVRDSNPWAMRWVGRPRHLPKPQELKAKTIPYDPAKSAKDNQFAGLASAQGLSDADRRTILAKGYTIRGEQQLIVDPKGNRLYSDTDLHGVYDANGKDVWSEGLKQTMNDSFLENMVQHPPHDNWPDRNNMDVAGPNAGPKPPITAYLPNGTTQHMNTMDEMKQFYTAHGMDWSALYPSY